MAEIDLSGVTAEQIPALRQDDGEKNLHSEIQEIIARGKKRHRSKSGREQYSRDCSFMSALRTILGAHDQDDKEKNQPDDFAVRTAEKHHAHRLGEAEENAAGETAEKRANAGEHDDDQSL